MKSNYLKKIDRKHIALTNIQIRIEKLCIREEEKMKLLDLVELALKYAYSNKFKAKFWIQITALYELIHWIEEKIR